LLKEFVHERRNVMVEIKTFVDDAIKDILDSDEFLWTEDNKHSFLGEEVQRLTDNHFNDSYKRVFGGWYFAKCEKKDEEKDHIVTKKSKTYGKDELVMNYCCSSYHCCGDFFSNDKLMALMKISEASAPLFMFGGGKKKLAKTSNKSDKWTSIDEDDVVDLMGDDSAKEEEEGKKKEKKKKKKKKKETRSKTTTVNKTSFQKMLAKTHLNNNNIIIDDNKYISSNKKREKSKPKKLSERTIIDLNLEDDAGLDPLVDKFVDVKWIDIESDFVTLTGEIIGEQIFEDKERNLFLVKWTPFGIEEDDWVLAKDFTGKKIIPLTNLTSYAKRNILQFVAKGM